ncbi:MAG: response regulator transcription factor [Leptolyngbyaceae cyanobacterium]
MTCVENIVFTDSNLSTVDKLLVKSGNTLVVNILIAEDEARIATFIEKGLRKAGYTTQIATDGHEAIALAPQCDLILLDIGLPGVDGWTVLKELGAQSSGVPVIVVTALDNAEERDRSLALGADDFISKPFRFKQLLACIRHHIQH